MSREPEPMDGIDERVRDVIEVWPDLLDPLVEKIVSRIDRIDRLIDKAALANLERVGLTHEEFKVLMELQRGDRSHGVLSRELMSSTGAMTNRLDKLERAGLVQRQPDPTDRRGVVLHLTASGRDRLEEYIAIQGDRERQLLAVLGEAEQQELDRLLRKLHMSLDAELGPPKKRSLDG